MALIPPFYLDAVVAIGADDGQGGRKWIASGFMYGEPVQRSSNQEPGGYTPYLVTNRHVFEGSEKAFVRLNPKDANPAQEFDLVLTDSEGKSLWLAHPNKDIDIAVVPIRFDILQERNMQVSLFARDKHVAGIADIKEFGITEGDFIYALGFPMGLIGGERNVVIVRSGVISRIRDTLEDGNMKYLVDAFLFPGNSGGPIVSKPEVTAIEGTQSQGTAYLIGIVQSYVPYRDVAISQQTDSPRVIFEENSGLAAVHPIDCVEEAIQTGLRAHELDDET